MKAISLLQPWATLCVIGAKQNETRSWATPYRGPLLIHASAGKKGSGMMSDPQVGRYFRQFIKGFHDLPFGAIIGQVDLVEIYSTDDGMPAMYEKGKGVPMPRPSDQELAFGDYSVRRFIWKLANPVRFDKPIPYKGSLSLWEYNGPLPSSIWKHNTDGTVTRIDPQ